MIESPDWESPELQGRGREPARRLLIPSSGEESARHSPPADSPWRQSLNGEWRFHLAANPAAAPDDFHQPDYSPAKHLAWAPITVPGNWQLQGYDIPYYTDVQLPFPPDDVPHVPATDNPTGCFRHEFTLPTHWAGRQIFLVFEGVDSAFHLWVNGVAVGFSKDSRVPAEFNITDHIRPGANLVAVRVYRWSDGTFLENQDMWRLSGIYRTVYLWSAPAVHLRSLEVTATLDDACQHGLLTVVAQVARFAPADTGHTLHFQLESAGGEALDQGTWSLEFGDEPELRLEFTNTVASPAPWSAESPTRYTLLASVRNPAGALLEIQRCAIGFRTVTIRDGQLCVNGKAILIKGVNRHEHDPVHGHFVDEASMRADLALMKQFNINAVRTAHYPNTPRWYELCDEYGIYLFAEANIECDGALAYLSKDPAWKPAFMARLQRMVACYRNHPSIIVWSLGNESGFGPHHLAMAAWLREADPTRPIHYHPAGDAAQVDILAPMYPSIERIIALAGQADERPIIMCEYAHSMGNATGNFAEYWEAIHAHRRLQGGFIWDWVDQGFRRIAADGQVWYAYGGDFGDVPNDGAFCLNGLVDADRVPRPALWECKKVLEPVTVEPIDLAAGAIRVRNEYHFLDLGHLTGTWSITCGRTVIDRGQLPLLATAPGERAIVMLPASSEIRLPFEQDAEECWLDVQFQLAEPALWAPAGHVVAHTQLAWPQARALRSPLAGPSTAMLTLQETATSIVVQGADWQMHFDRQSGLLAPVVHQARLLLLAGPRFTFWRAPTDNDVGTYGTEKMLFAWQDAGLDRLDETVVSVTWQMPSPERAIVTVCSQLAPRPSGERSAWWGWLLEQLHLLLVQCWGPTELQQIAAELGVRFDMPAGAQKSAKVAALIAYLDAEQRGQALVNTVYKWLIETTDPDAFSSMKERLAPWSRMDAATFTAEFALRDQVCFDGRLTYTIHGDGAVHLEAYVAPNGVLPPLPRIGLMLEVPQAFQNFTWYGRGPGENYPDRKQGMPMGIYSGLIDDQFVAYGRPQENGNKSDVRWATLTDDRGNGLRVAGVTPLNVSAHRFTPADLSNARHPHEVVRRERIYFTVDFAHAGLGNASCGPGVLPQYQIQPETVSFDLWIHPVTNKGAASSP